MEGIKIIKTELEKIRHFRTLFLHESNFQFIYNKCHDYGWADVYLFTVGGIEIGYGAVWGQSKREDRDAIFEFFLVAPYRAMANEIFPLFHAATNAVFIECQSNDKLLSNLLYEYAKNINAEAILFEDSFETKFCIPEIIFQKKTPEENVRTDYKYNLLLDNIIVASGGFMLNYNIPYADIYYEVNENYRRRGLGSLLVQELKKEAYAIGRVPAARCNIKNTLSKKLLLKTGFTICGHILVGEI